MSALVERQMLKAKENGREMKPEKALEEVVADSMESMLADGSFGEVLARIQSRDKTLWQKIRDWFRDVAEKLKAAADDYRGYAPDSTEGKLVRQMDEMYAELQKLFAEGLVEASGNYAAAEGQKNTTREGGNNDAKDVLYSERNDIVDVNGKEYDSVVMLDKPVPKRVLSDQKAFSKFLAKNLFNKKITVLDKNGDVEIIEFAGEKERVSKGGKSRLVRGELARATGDVRKVIILNLEEVAQLSSYDPVFSSNDHSHGWLDDHGWESRKTFVTDGDMIYEAFLKIGKTADGRNVLYAINCNIENGIAVDKSATSKRAAVRTSNADRKMVTSAPPKVKRNSDRSGVEMAREQEQAVIDLNVTVDAETESVAPSVLFSERTWTQSEYVQERDMAALAISKAIGVSIQKAKDYIDSVNSIAKMIADDRTRLDYFSSPGRSSFIGNVEYGGSFDFSTLCKKRRLLTGTFTAIQKALPNTALTANEILEIRKRMQDAGLEVSCGLCYVEGSRANMGQFAKEFLRLYKQYYPDGWQPNMADVNTPEGIEWVRINHPEG